MSQPVTFYNHDGEKLTAIPVEIVGEGGSGGGGMRFIFGTVNPTDADGAPNDVYLNTTSYDLYKNENGTWSKKGNLKGAKGATGSQGEQGIQGETGATGTAGADGFGTEAQYTDIITRLEALEAPPA